MTQLPMITIKHGFLSNGQEINHIVVPMIAPPVPASMKGCRYVVTVDTSSTNFIFNDQRKNRRIFFKEMSDVSFDGQTHNVLFDQTSSCIEILPERSDSEIKEEISNKFEVLELMVEGVIKGEVRALIACGAPGCGKTYIVNEVLKKNSANLFDIKGTISPSMMYSKLWDAREEGSVLLIDDADTAISDLESLNLLKAAMDTCKVRTISYNKLNSYHEEQGIPQSFEFYGSVIFLSNINFNRECERNSKISPHIQAFMSRSHVVDVTLDTLKERLIRIKMVVDTHQFRKVHHVSEQQTNMLIDWIDTQGTRLREVSIRTIAKLIDLVKAHPSKWEKIAKVTLCK